MRRWRRWGRDWKGGKGGEETYDHKTASSLFQSSWKSFRCFERLNFSRYNRGVSAA